MSHGPGHVERAIAEAFARYPFKAFYVGGLCLLVWPELKPRDVKHKHRVSVRRAAEKVAPKAGWKVKGFMCGAEKVLYVGPLAERADPYDDVRLRNSAAQWNKPPSKRFAATTSDSHETHKVFEF